MVLKSENKSVHMRVSAEKVTWKKLYKKNLSLGVCSVSRQVCFYILDGDQMSQTTLWGHLAGPHKQNNLF